MSGILGVESCRPFCRGCAGPSRLQDRRRCVGDELAFGDSARPPKACRRATHVWWRAGACSGKRRCFALMLAEGRRTYSADRGEGTSNGYLSSNALRLGKLRACLPDMPPTEGR